MKKFNLTNGIFLMLVMFFTACEKDDGEIFEKPNVTAPAEAEEIPVGATDLSVSFSVSVDARLSASYTATGT